MEASDVIKVMLQFLEENGLEESASVLVKESGVALNAVASPAKIAGDVRAGKWDQVLQETSKLWLSSDLARSLHEHILIELIEVGEITAARKLLASSQAIGGMESDDPERKRRLERLLEGAAPTGTDVEYPGGLDREQRRSELAESLESEVTTAPKGRLLTLIGQALRWQRHTGALPPGQEVDLLRGGEAPIKEEAERPPEKAIRHLRFGQDSRPECAEFSPDGVSLAVGTRDGFVELYAVATGKLRDDLPYQSEGDLLAHEEGVMSLAFSSDCELLATGTAAGRLKAFRIGNGKCIRRLERAHRDAVTSIHFSPDGSSLLSSSLDCTARVHGLRSGTCLKEFRGHSAAVTSAHYAFSGSRCLTASADGALRMWDARSGECSSVIRLPQDRQGQPPSVCSLAMYPKPPERAISCTKASSCHIISLPNGDVSVSFRTGREPGSGADLTACVPSPRGSYVYCLGEDGLLYAFSASGKLDHSVKAHEVEPAGVCHHPHANLLATFSVDGSLRIWAPS